MSNEPPRQFRVTSVRRSTQMPDAGKDAEAWDFEVIDGIELAVKGDDLETAAVTGLRGLIGVVNALQQQLAEARQELETLKSDLGLDDVFTANAELFQRAINAEQERDRYKAALEQIERAATKYEDTVATNRLLSAIIADMARAALAPDAGG